MFALNPQIFFELTHHREPYFKAPDFHSHDFFELYFFIDGSVTYHIEENVYELTRGDVLLIPPGELHRPVIVNPQLAYERIVLWIEEGVIREVLGDGEFTDELFSVYRGKKHLVHLETDELKKYMDIMSEIISCNKSDKTEDKALISPNLSIILINLYKAAKNMPAPRGEADSTISRLIIYLNENISQELSLDMLSEIFFVSKYHLIRTFKSYTNTTIGQYIISKRITKAKLFLAQGDTLLEASRKSGFNNYSNFYKAFVKETGMSPSSFLDK